MLFSGDELANNTVLELRAQGQLSAFNKQPNLTFETDAPAILQQAVAQTREFNIDVTNGLINQRRFDPRKVDVMARKGTIERWIFKCKFTCWIYYSRCQICGGKPRRTSITS